jgi:hypothetical protein
MVADNAKVGSATPKFVGFKKNPPQAGRLHKESLVDPVLSIASKSMIYHSCG